MTPKYDVYSNRVGDNKGGVCSYFRVTLVSVRWLCYSYVRLDVEVRGLCNIVACGEILLLVVLYVQMYCSFIFHT